MLICNNELSQMFGHVFPISYKCNETESNLDIKRLAVKVAWPDLKPKRRWLILLHRCELAAI